MRVKQLYRIWLLVLALALVLVACGGEEDNQTVPTPMPTAVVPETGDDGDTGGVAGAEPTAVPSPSPTPIPEPAVDVANIDWPPQLVYSSPAPGDEVTLDGAITLRFDQPMDRSAVESAFAVTEPDGSAVEGEFTWTREDTLVFTPRSLKRQADYKVQVAETAASTNGQSLLAPIELDVRTVGFLEVSQVIPGDGAAAVETDAAITVLFNRPVVPLVTTGQQAGLPQPLDINPPVAGSGEWVSTSIYRFTPDNGLVGATTYEVTVAAGLEDITGGVLEEAATWRFTTRSPQVVSVDPANGAEGVVPSRALTITFNMPMDRTSTEAAVIVPGVGAPAADVTYVWSEGDRVLTLKPEQRLELETEYQVVVGPSAAAAGGEVTLGADEVSAFTTVPFPAVLYTRPAADSLAGQYEYGVTIGFASPMELDTLEDRIIIEPEPDRVDYYWADYSNELVLNFALERNATYEITIPADAADPYGNTLGQPYTWRFDTPDYEPIASFNLPPGISQLSTSFVTQVDIIHRNVSQLNVDLYEIGLPLNLLINSYDLYDYRPATPPRQSWNIEPESEDGLATLPLADGGTLPTGVYFLSLSAPEIDPDSRYWQNQRHLLVVADTNIVVKEMFDEVHVWVTDIADGQPAAGRNLELFNARGAPVTTAVSDGNGFASFSRTQTVDYLDGVTVVSNQPGGSGFGVASSSWTQGISPWEFGLEVGYNAPAPLFSYLYTDRPIYRPGDTVYFKGIVRDSDYGRYFLPSPQNVGVSLNPAFYVEGESLTRTFTFELSPDGTFHGEFALPEEMSLGTYQFSMNNQEYEAFRSFTVAEYRAPEFLVSLMPETTEALRGDQVAVTLEASYFFGGPAADLPVNWSVSADAYYPDVPGPYYSFGDRANFFYENIFPFPGGGGVAGEFLIGGEGRTNADGRLTINLPVDLLDEIEAGSRRVTVEASVMDLSNFPVSSRTGITFHAANTYVGVTPAEYLSSAGQETAVDLLTVDWDGNGVGNQDVEVVFYRREWNSRRTTDFGMYRTIWEPVDTEVARAQVQTDAQGRATAAFSPEDGGTYLAVATVTDDAGRRQTSSAYLWVTDRDYIGWRSAQRERRMELVPDKQAYVPGETAQILVQSPFAGPVQAWVTVERGRLLNQRLVTLQTNSDIIEVPLPAGYAPNVHVAVVAVKPVTPGDENPYADIRLGVTELVVSPQQLLLDVTLAPQQESFGPGETAVYDIRVTDYQGSPVAAELSLALVDLAVLTLKDDNAPPISEAFYRRQPYRSQVSGSLFVSGEGLEPEIPLQGGGFGGGGGGVADEALARAVAEEDGVRRDFPDTAFWRAVVNTDASGEATVEIPLPDSLTTWRLSSKAVTDDSLVGQASVDVQVSLPLLLRPVTPRFLTVGDVVQLGTIINNNSGSAIEATASLEATGLGGDLADQTVTVPANGQTIVRWEVTVEDVEFADLTFRVSGGGYQDATKPTFGEGPDQLIPVYRYDAEDVVGTSGVLDEAGRRVEAVLLPSPIDPRRGTVDITMSPSLAAALIESLEALEELPYEPACAHAVADRLLPNAATARALRELSLADTGLLTTLDELIPTQITRIENLAKSGGGWGWCYSGQRNEWLTAYVLFALIQAQEAGYAVSPQVMNNAEQYLFNNLADPDDLTAAYEVDRQVFLLYVLHLGGEDVPVLYDRLVSEKRDLMSPYAQAMLATVYANSGFTPENLETLLADLNDSVIVSATGAHWEDETPDSWQNLSSDIRNTAIVINALSQIEPDNPWLPGAVRWLMVARQAQRWSSAHETAWSILSLTEWMAATGELEANYEYSLALNLETETQGSFTPADVTGSDTTSIPVSELVPDDVNYFAFARGEGNGRLYYTMHLDSFLLAESVQQVSRGLTVQRTYYDAACDPDTEECEPIASIAAGQEVRVELTIVAPSSQVYLVVRDPIPAGAEAIDPGLNTSASGTDPEVERTDQDYRYGYWGWWYFNRVEFRDEQVVFFAGYLPAGTYQYTYYLQATIPGDYQVMPATARQEFFPEVFGRSNGLLFSIGE